jgi:spermidine/putrescine transport system permease protein
MKFNLKWLGIVGIWTWFGLFALTPVVLVIIMSLLQYDAQHLIRWTPTSENYARLLNPIYFYVFWRSFLLASLCAGFCVIIAYPFTYFLARLKKPLLLLLVIIPFWTSSLIRTYSIIALLKAKGLINTVLLHLHLITQPLEILYTNTAVMIGLIYNLLPFMILPLYASMEKLDLRLIEAARDLGANRITVFKRVIFPLTLPGLMSGILLVLLPAMTLFYIPDILGGARSLLVGNLITDQFLLAHNWPMGSAVSVSLGLLMAVLLWVYFKTNRDNNLINPDEFKR